MNLEQLPEVSTSSPAGLSRLRVAYDAQCFLAHNGGTGKGSHLRTLIEPYQSVFIGLTSEGPRPPDLKIVQKGLDRYQLWQQTYLPALLSQENVDIFLAPANTAPLYLPRRVSLVLVLHDLIIFHTKVDKFSRRGLLESYKRKLTERAVSKARVILTVSEYSRSEILQRFPAAPVHVIPNTISESWFTHNPVPFTSRDNYILLITSEAPHKNAAGALSAYSMYRQISGIGKADLRVVGLSGNESAYREKAKHLGISEFITFEPYASKETLQSLYRNAQVALIPSFREGFGIPVLEAMASGTPVLTSNTTSLPEVGGDAALYFDPSSSEQIAHCLCKVLSDPATQNDLASRGLVRAQRFHPAVVKRQVQEFWQSLA